MLTIADAVTRLAVARGALLDDVGAEVYMQGLRDLSPFLVKQACWTMGLERRAEYESAMPPLAVIRDRVEQLAVEERARAAAAKCFPLPVPADPDAALDFCAGCQDTGWTHGWCPGVGVVRVDDPPIRYAAEPRVACGRMVSHSPHTVAPRCPCVDTNPVICARRTRLQAHSKRKMS